MRHFRFQSLSSAIALPILLSLALTGSRNTAFANPPDPEACPELFMRMTESRIALNKSASAALQARSEYAASLSEARIRDYLGALESEKRVVRGTKTKITVPSKEAIKGLEEDVLNLLETNVALTRSGKLRAPLNEEESQLTQLLEELLESTKDHPERLRDHLRERIPTYWSGDLTVGQVLESFVNSHAVARSAPAERPALSTRTIELMKKIREKASPSALADFVTKTPSYLAKRTFKQYTSLVALWGPIAIYYYYAGKSVPGLWGNRYSASRSDKESWSHERQHVVAVQAELAELNTRLRQDLASSVSDDVLTTAYLKSYAELGRQWRAPPHHKKKAAEPVLQSYLKAMDAMKDQSLIAARDALISANDNKTAFSRQVADQVLHDTFFRQGAPDPLRQYDIDLARGSKVFARQLLEAAEATEKRMSALIQSVDERFVAPEN